MTDIESPQRESVHVQLTRMEGKMDLVDYKINEVIKTSESHGARLAHVELTVQQLQDEAKAATATRIATAEAVQLADDARMKRSDAHWSPWQRAAVIIASITAITMTVIALFK